MADIDTSREAVDQAVADLSGTGHAFNASILEAVANARDVAVAQARYIAKALKKAADERDEALAREATLRDALAAAAKYVEAHAPEYWDTPPEVQQVRAALTNTATAAAARDAALVEQGRREGIEEAALVAEQTDEEGVFPQWCDGPEIADAIRALATPRADGGPDAR